MTIDKLISSSTFQGAAAVAALITAVASNNWWVRGPALLVIFGALFQLRSLLLYWALRVWKFLTWKFLLGAVLGIMLTIVLDPFVELPSTGGAVAYVDVIRSEPADGETMDSPDRSIKIFFSEDIEESRRDLIEVSVDPRHRLELSWIVDNLMSSSPNPTNELHIRGIEYQEDGEKRFKYDTNYQLTIKGAALNEPVVIGFHTPPRPD